MVALNPPGENISNGGPDPATSKRVGMPSITAVDALVSDMSVIREHPPSDPNTAGDLSCRPHIVGVSQYRVVCDLSDVGVGVRRIVQSIGAVADRRGRHPH